MDSWHSYPSIYALGHRAVSELFTRDVYLTEKVDGSQFSFGSDMNGEVRARSKGQELHIDAPEKMFSVAVNAVLAIKDRLTPGWTYRGEYLRSPKHNTLSYSRVPHHNVILFDINDGHESYLPYEELEAEAERIGMEVVPRIFTGRITSAEQLLSFLDRESILGGVKIEGIVVKPVAYDLFGADKKVLMGKFVSEAFKEIHGKEWKAANPAQSDILTVLAARYATEARWEKAIQHLLDRGELEGSPRDIGKLLKEVQADTHKECADEIKEALFKWAWGTIGRKLTHGFPEWYKRKLADSQFEDAA